tara:strand:- start:2394 stop:3272 length:879 start_codon:yes stop_codon:yes gene_type:complete
MLDITPTNGFPNMYNFISNKVAKGVSPVVLVIFTVILILYYVLFSFLKGGGSGDATSIVASKSTGLVLIEVMMWGMFVFLILINGIQYFFKIDIQTSIKNLFSPVPEIDIAVISSDPRINLDAYGDHEAAGVPEITTEPQVFHVGDNKYTYGAAKALCNAYDADLASYEQIEDAYRGGAEWCGFGWSDNQMALYPTQKKTWDDLQQIPGHKHDCGRPGINGGYIDNKNVRFGVNCFGYKPKITPLERTIMENEDPIPKTKKEMRFNEQINQYKKILPEILVSPFNYNKWSQI